MKLKNQETEKNDYPSMEEYKKSRGKLIIGLTVGFVSTMLSSCVPTIQGKQRPVRRPPPGVMRAPKHDRDGDGVQDSNDHCPDTPGAKQNNGCPKPRLRGKPVHPKSP